MNVASRIEHPDLWDWRQLASLGEQLRNENSLIAQRDRIIAMTNHLLKGKVDVWLNESVFRLPDWSAEAIFPPAPPLDGMKQAVQAHKLYIQNKNQKAKTKSASRRTLAAILLEDQGFTLGALQITRAQGPAFSDQELNLLKSISQIAATGLYAAHRAEVEQFRLRQINLVRNVSAQIANALSVDELAKRVTKLIQTTFNFYYVAIFTLTPNSETLRFRSSAVAPRKGRRKAAVALEVEVGQGLIGEAVQSGRQIVCDDVLADAHYRFIDSLPETRSEAVIPLKVEKRVLGVLDVQSNQPHAFHPNDLLILNALADNIARAVEGARLYSNLRRRADQMTLVSEVSKSVTSTLNLSEIMYEAANLIHRQFKYPHVSLFTVHPNRRIIAYEAGSGRRSKKLEGYTISLDTPQGIMVWTARLGKTILVNDVTKDERYVPSPLPPKNIRSELCVPLIFNEKVVGLLDVQSDKANAFTKDDQVMFEAVADTMAAAIRNADLYRSERWRRQTADSLRDVAGLISTNTGVEEVFETILSELNRSLPVDISAIWLLEDDKLCLAAVQGVSPMELENVCIAEPTSTYAMAEALLADLPIIRRPDEPMWPSGLSAGYDENYSSIAAPLRVGDRPLGLLTLAHHTAGRYGHEAQALTTTFASYAAVAIENARLFDSAQEQAYASAALLQVAQAVVSLSELDEILETIIRIIPILVGVRRVALYRWDAEKEGFSASHEFGFSEAEEAFFTEREFAVGEFPLLDTARNENRIVVCSAHVEELEAWTQILPTVENEAYQIETAERLLMAVPLAIKHDLFGVILIEEADHARRFRHRRLEIIQGIAQQAALAIQNDLLQQEMVSRERLETEVQLARQIQQTFIPSSLPAHPAWQLAARWRTARQVGGDFYDVIELENGKLGLFIADVADKGMPAALFMALTRTLIRAAVKETDSPAEVLSRVNEQLLPDTQQGMFVTAVYGELDLASGEFVYVNAGHNPPFWIKANGVMEKLTRTAVALGVMEQPLMKQKSILLNEQDLLLLYTDGVTESFSPDGDLFGEERLLSALQNQHAQSAEEVLEAVETCLNHFSDPLPPADDLTMLALKKLRNEK